MVQKISEIAKILDKKCEDQREISTLLTDSRNLEFPEETIFFALSTPGNDGHKYIGDLYQQGVKYFVIKEDFDTSNYPNAIFWKVANPLEALQEIAKENRNRITTQYVVGITGSRGKTIVKELLNQLLRMYYTVSRSPRSYNSQIGVPLSVFGSKSDCDVAIFEAGISEKGEMQRLEEIIRPTIGIFTSLTEEHQEGFESLEQKAEEKASLFVNTKDIFYTASPIIEKALHKVCPNATLHPVKGNNQDLALAVAAFIAKSKGEEIPFVIGTDNSERYVPRFDVCETLKNCVIVYDAFTNDMNALNDALRYSRRHTDPSRNLTLITCFPSDFESGDFIKKLRAHNVQKLVAIGFAQRIKDAPCQIQYVGDINELLRRYSISDFNDEIILIKDTPEQELAALKAQLEEPRHETVMEVNLGAITHNFNYYRSLMPRSQGLVAMVKAAGYGVGSIELARTLQAQGAAYLAVAVVDEGAELRRAGITMPIIVMNPMGTNYKALFDNRLEPSVFSQRELEVLLDNANRLGIKDYPVHLKLDTGMHRLGFLENELSALIEKLNSQESVRVASIFSHLATADCLDENDYTYAQLRTFDNMSNKIMSGLPYPIKRHILNTAGMMRFPEYHYDMSRLGIGLYGVSPIEQDKDKLQVVARLFTTIISLKHWTPGTTIGYGRRGHVDKPSIIATIPIGYADGLDRHLSNGAAYVLVNGHQCPIIGNICMDQCMIDVTDAQAKIGDKVEVFGENAPIERLSNTLGTIPYEILTSISPRVKRIYYRE